MVSGLHTAVHSGFACIQEIELAGTRIEPRAQYLVAAPADDQELVASKIGIDVHDVVAERFIEAGGR